MITCNLLELACTYHQSLNVADNGSLYCNEIDILISSDYYWQVNGDCGLVAMSRDASILLTKLLE